MSDLTAIENVRGTFVDRLEQLRAELVILVEKGVQHDFVACGHLSPRPGTGVCVILNYTVAEFWGSHTRRSANYSIAESFAKMVKERMYKEYGVRGFPLNVVPDMYQEMQYALFENCVKFRMYKGMTAEQFCAYANARIQLVDWAVGLIKNAEVKYDGMQYICA